MTRTETIERHEAVVARLLEIDVLLTESKRIYFNSGTDALTMAERTTLEAEVARLKLEKNALTLAMHECKRAVATARRLTSHAILINLLVEQGLSSLVSQAERMALEHQLKTGTEA